MRRTQPTRAGVREGRKGGPRGLWLEWVQIEIEAKEGGEELGISWGLDSSCGISTGEQKAWRSPYMSF